MINYISRTIEAILDSEVSQMRRFPRGLRLLTLAAATGSAIAFSASTVIIKFVTKYSSREQSSIRTKREGRGEGLLRSDLSRILLRCV